MDITGASAIVTGAASGIGAACARQLAAKGAKVVVADLQADKGEELAAEIGGKFAQVDVTNTDQIKAAVELAASLGDLRVLVNSACDWGVSDPLKVRKTADKMAEAGFSADDIDRLVWRNPVEFFGQSNRLILDDIEAPDLTATFEGSGVLRGER